MKMDKIGACTVIAAIGTVARLAPGTPLLAVAAGRREHARRRTRPGPATSSRRSNGKWVDITNTDAEGRLILGDAMTYAEQLGATHIVDVATLTGAVSRAFGHLITGAFGTPQGWYDAGHRGGRPGRASATGRSRSSTTTSRTWRAGTAISRTPARPRARSSRAASSCASSGRCRGPTSTSAARATSARPCPYAARGATGVTHATLVELALAGATRGVGTARR